jgi:hypothetical protein
MAVGRATLADRFAVGVVAVVVLLSPVLFDLGSALGR